MEGIGGYELDEGLRIKIESMLKPMFEMLSALMGEAELQCQMEATVNKMFADETTRKLALESVRKMRTGKLPAAR